LKGGGGGGAAAAPRALASLSRTATAPKGRPTATRRHEAIQLLCYPARALAGRLRLGWGGGGGDVAVLFLASNIVHDEFSQLVHTVEAGVDGVGPPDVSHRLYGGSVGCAARSSSKNHEGIHDLHVDHTRHEDVVFSDRAQQGKALKQSRLVVMEAKLATCSTSVKQRWSQ
jgi:hypothetical protein